MEEAMIGSRGSDEKAANRANERLGATVGLWEWDVATGRIACSPGLELIHHRVPGMFTGTYAISILRKAGGQISAVLLDMTMPVMSGEETLRQVREFEPDIHVILSSGFSEMEALERFSGKVIEGFVQKPYAAA
jgi:CheY-like chemotaxis protein